MVYVPGNGLIDLSIMPWLECDLQCPHCQYDAGPEHDEHLDRMELIKFLQTVDWADINSIGFYGGEVFLDLNTFGRYVAIVKSAQLNAGIKKTKLKPMWCISNGTFSKSASHFANVITFVHLHNLRVYISTTSYHKEDQHKRIRNLTKASDNFRFKKDDTKSRLLPMGRNYVEDWYCTRRCQRLEIDRLAIKPNGDVLYQKCDGIYPVVGNISGNHVSWTGLKYLINTQFNCPMLHKDIDLGEPSWIKYAEKRLDQQEQSLLM